RLYYTTFTNLVAAEKEAFSDDSYFYRRELNLSTTPEFICDSVYYTGF
ncbi:hypothetical protein PENNAL_c0341G06770, partial [Penicillium nalgiovense]